jgi:hypothetical protein
MDRDRITQNLFLALRTCATHPAGPLRAVAELHAAIADGALSAADGDYICAQALRRYRAQGNVPDDRLFTVEHFLAAVAGGVGFRDAPVEEPPGWGRLWSRVQAARQAVIAHPIYEAVDDLDALRVFMQHHVFAVWDFMSLLTRLQVALTCTRVPWVPPADPEAARFLNEIKLTEESDVAPWGGHVSHFGLYLAAMTEVGADTSVALALTEHTNHSAVAPLPDTRWFLDGGVPLGAARFAAETFRILNEGSVVEAAAAFTLGREQVIPEMFDPLLGSADEVDAPLFREYLRRHIELDGDLHGPIAQRLLTRLCGDDPEAWELAEAAALSALAAREALWDATLTAIREHRDGELVRILAEQDDDLG